MRNTPPPPPLSWYIIEIQGRIADVLQVCYCIHLVIWRVYFRFKTMRQHICLTGIWEMELFQFRNKILSREKLIPDIASLLTHGQNFPLLWS